MVAEPNHVFVNTGDTDTTFTIELIASSPFGCADTVTQDVTVLPTPNASFIATPVTQIFPNSTVNIQNTSSGGSFEWMWTFGDGSDTTVRDPGNHFYSTWNTYTITLIQSSEFCADTVMQDITIIPPVPVADFLGEGIGCTPLEVSFTDQSEWAQTWEWDFGDGVGTSTQQNPTYTYFVSGTYSVTLTITGPGGSEFGNSG